MAKHWNLLPHHPAAIAQLAQSLRVSPIVAQLLLQRGLEEPAAARHFLDAPLTDLHKPETLPGAAEAADRLHRAVQQGRRICIYGDYDVDGVTGTAILWQALRLMGAEADYYVPHRLDEGYGLNIRALHQVARSGAAVVVTVDCGITALAEAAEARRLGLELIVTDHHEPRPELPQADLIVHPRLPGAAYPFAGLSGAGVAFKVAWALCQRACGSERVTPVYREFLLDGVTLAALGLVADVVPLREENRLFVRHGLARLARIQSPGLRALLDAAGLASKAPLLADDVSYKLAPRLNAAGRLGPARLVVELLTTTSPQRAGELVRNLEISNQQRQQLERRILAQARELAGTDGLKDAPGLVLSCADWHPGVIGIVAGRLAEQFARPAMLVAVTEHRSPAPPEGDPGTGLTVVGHGSGRSVPGVPLHEALAECSDLLLGHGGHAAAAGFKIIPDRIPEFRERFCAAVARRFPDGLPPPRVIIDAEIPLASLTFDLPLFLSGGLEVMGAPAKVGGGERHLSFRVRQQRTTIRAIAFNMAERLDELMSAGGQCCLVYTPRANEWQGYRRLDLEVVDFQPGPRARLE
jgi:single-stranded-DNA-specific exonuclease